MFCKKFPVSLNSALSFWFVTRFGAQVANWCDNVTVGHPWLTIELKSPADTYSEIFEQNIPIAIRYQITYIIVLLTTGVKQFNWKL